MCFRESYEKNTQHKLEIGRCNCILSKKNIKLQPVPPPMPLEALLIPENLTDSDSDGIGGGISCNFIFFLLCRLLVVGPVLKWLALCMYLFIYYCADYL